MALLFAALFCAPTSRAAQTVVANYGGSSLYILDLSTGNRTVLSSSSVGTGPALASPVGLTVDPDGNILTSEDYSNTRILKIAPLTGNRTLVSGPTRGTGTNLQATYGIAVNSAGTIYAASTGSNSIIQVDPVTGNRTVIASPSVGSGEPISGPFGIAVEPSGDVVYSEYTGFPKLVRLNVSTGVRTLISGASRGTGPTMTSLAGLARMTDGSFAVADYSNTTDSVIKIDPVTGNRTTITGSSVGTGPTIGYHYGVTFDSSGVLYLADFSNNLLLQVDTATGNRTVISSASVGTGPAYDYPLGILPFTVASFTAPNITSALTASGTEGAAFTYNITATGSPTSYNATGLPTGLTVDTTTGAITGTPTQAGSYNVTLSATGAGGTGTATLTLTIAAAPVPPSITSATTDSATQNTAYSYTITASNNPTSFAASPLPTGLVLDTNTGVISGTPTQTGLFPINLGATNANGTGTATLTLTVAAASVAPTINSATTDTGTFNTAYSYTITASGSPTSFGATSLPPGLAVDTTTGVISGTPTLAGTYTIGLSASNATGTGNASLTLTLAKAAQSVNFTAVSGAQVGSPVTLTATATSGLPVTFSVTSGNATLSGSSLTINDTAAVSVRATQAGDVNYDAAFADQSITATQITTPPPSLQSQSISFVSPGDKPNNAGPFTLQATATSGLPVTFTIVSGPAFISGNTVTLTGAPGTVIIKAAQAGDATYAPAPDVTQSIMISAIGPQVFFGQSSSNDKFAANISNGSTTGEAIGYLGASKQAFTANFTVAGDGSISGTADLYDAPSTASATVAADRQTSATGPANFRTAPAPSATRTITGTLVNGTLTFILSDGSTFTANIEPPTGPTLNVAGYYEAVSTNTVSGAIYSVVGTTGKVYTIAITPTLVTAGDATLNADNSFTVAGASGSTVNATIDPSSTSITGTVTSTTGGPASSFAGTNADVQRTDRLINLSSRASITADPDHTLITGLVIKGDVNKRILVRAIGPTLSQYGITKPVANPKLTVYNGAGQVINSNDDWASTDAAEMARIGAFALPSGSKDSALLLDLAPGAYTFQISGNNDSGVALAEIYDASLNPQSEYQRLVNISSRGFVTNGENVLIGGFIVTGNTPKRVLIRGVGPALAAYGVPNFLPDPLLEIYDSHTSLIAKNDNWETPTAIGATQRSATAAEITSANTDTGAFALATGSKDAEVVITLAPGAYSAVVRSAGSGQGVALIEVYEMSE